ncbi:calcium-binding protein [Neisseria dentiae]|uniref:calcium-binding protein n=1 Tax=Neisseria dentiae TaxID=194197 RepID=UPI0035A00B75
MNANLNTYVPVAGNDVVVVVGTQNNDVLYGSLGRTVIYGNGGNDTIYGLSGLDTMYGGEGNDTFHIKGSGDTVTEEAGEGTDTIYSSVSYTASRNVENLVLTGDARINGTGNNSDNTITGNDNYNRLNGGRGNDTIYGNGGEDTIDGGEGDDKLYGGADRDHIFGGTGNDYIDGGTGNDLLRGQAGNDTYYFAQGYGHDVVRDTEGSNTVRFGSGITVNDITVREEGANWVITLKETGDTLTLENQSTAADAAVTSFEFSDGLYNASELWKAVNGTQPDEASGQTIIGTPEADRLIGGDGNDLLIGNEGNDYFDGGAGNDRMEGGLGHDTYYFGKGSGQDTVLDFGIIGFPNGDALDAPRAENTLRFGSGIKPEDLEITVTKGYEGQGEIEFPFIVTRMETNGDTWHIRIKDTDDSITLLNQTNGYSAVSFFEFDDQTLTSYEISQLFGFGYTKTEVAMADNQTHVIFNDEYNPYLSADDVFDIHKIDGGRLLGIYSSWADDVNQVGYEVAEPSSLRAGNIRRHDVIFVPDNDVTEANLQYWQYDSHSDDTTRHNQIIEFTVSPADGDYATYTNAYGTVYIANNPEGSVLGSSTGPDVFYGYVGNDAYRFGFGSGQDVLADTGGYNTLYFGEGVTMDNITAEAVRVAENTYNWKIQIIDTDNVLTIQKQFNDQSGPAVSEFVFADGSSISSDSFGELFELFPVDIELYAAAGSVSDGLLESSQTQALESGLAAWSGGSETETVVQGSAGMVPNNVAYANNGTAFYTEDNMQNIAVI